jgi:hypothetical protein
MRREFITKSARAGAEIMTSSLLQAYKGKPANKVVPGIMGANSRGLFLAQTFAGLPDVEIAYVCDPDGQHLHNFYEAIRGNEKINAPILEGHKSTLLPQLGNIAYRVGRSLKCEPSNRRILNDRGAMKLWSRDYASGWEPRI